VKRPVAIHAQNSLVSEECLNLHRQFWRKCERQLLHWEHLQRNISRGIGVFVNSDGKLGTSVSSRRFKDDIKPMDKTSEAILSLQPVTFHYKKELDPTKAAQFGLVAEDVEKVNPDLVVRDKDGKAYSVRYDQVNAMLLNEFLKEHRKVEELQKTVAQQQNDFQAIAAEQKKEIQALAETIRDQAAQIQKVNARLELTESRSRTVLNDTHKY
jgi:hypothetical protein